VLGRVGYKRLLLALAIAAGINAGWHRTLSNFRQTEATISSSLLTTAVYPCSIENAESDLCLNSKRPAARWCHVGNAVDDHCGAVMLDRMVTL